MVLSAAAFDSTVLSYKIAKQTITNATPNIDVTAEAGKLYEIILANGSSSNAYFKAVISENEVTVGNTIPQLMIRVNAAETKRWTIPTGLTFTKLSFWAVTGPADNNTTSPTLNSGNGLVTTIVTT
jgi:hypothetical protein|tara:strand:+ start:47 stop:424 length:378 start_codon:yes stop_codon:yes gene_type:complete